MKPITPDYLKEIRQCLRIRHEQFDGEITDLIQAARADLASTGVLPKKAEDESDPLIKRAVTIYVKSEFGLDNPDSEKYRASYEKLRNHLALSNDYILSAEEE